MTQEQASILLELIQNDSKFDWSSLGRGRWDKDIPVCDWPKISCHHGDVVGLHLKGLGIDATLPESLSQISSLRIISLGSNYFRGTIPEKIVNLPLLTEIDLSKNQLSGTVPTISSNILESVHFGHNRLSGNLPDILGRNKVNLKRYNIESNKIEGIIPSNITNLGVDSLVELKLSKNNLSGPIPLSIGEFTKLKSLHLNQNRLNGEIPRLLFQNMNELSDVFLFGNNLSGTLPLAISELSNLSSLLISGNKLIGEIPDAICQMNLNTLFFEGKNRRLSLDKPFGETESKASPDPSKNRSLIGETNERNGCNSIACPVGQISSKIGDGLFPCIPCEEGKIAPYLGSSTCLDINEDIILNSFLRATVIDSWSIDELWTVETPPCDRHGVTCTNSNKVRSIRLPSMNISGTITPMLGFLQHLQELDLSRNNFFGTIPSDLQFAPLEHLDITGNQLTGNIPRSLCRKDGVNGNGQDSVWSCDKIACPVGTFSKSDSNNEKHCMPCTSLKKQIQYLGSSGCDSDLIFENTSSHKMKSGILIALIIFLFFILGSFYFFLRKLEKNKHGIHSSKEPKIRQTELTKFSNGRPHISSKRRVSLSNGRGIDQSKELWLDVPRIT